VELRPERVIADLRELQRRTGDADGAQRVCWTPVWQEARSFLRELLAGSERVEVDIDEAGNLWATLPGELDEAVAVGKSYAEGDPGTLVIVAADHETGSLAIEDTNELQSDPEYPNESGEGRTSEDGPFDVAGSDKQFLVDWTTANHTAEDVPVTAMGPGGEDLVGVYENTHIHDAMLNALFGSAAASASASASASTSGSAGVHAMPETGGLALNAPLLALAMVLLGITGIAYVSKVVRRP
jgi:hypothetical protein